MANENNGKVVELQKKTIKDRINEMKIKREQKKSADPEKTAKRKKILKGIAVGACVVIGGVITGVCLFGKNDDMTGGDENSETVTGEEIDVSEAPSEE